MSLIGPFTKKKKEGKRERKEGRRKEKKIEEMKEWCCELHFMKTYELRH